MKFSMLILMLVSNIIFAQEPIVYRLNWVEHYNIDKVTRFVSLSDQYYPNNHKDSLAMPASYLGERTGPVEEYIRLNGKYRKRCLDALNIQDTDIVYIYDYSSDQLLRFYVRGLNLIAVLSPYSYGDNYPVSQYDYMIGFEINSAYLSGFRDYYSHVMVSIGKTNPFTKGKMKPIAWSKVDSSLFPVTAKLLEKNRALSAGKAGDTYQFKMNNLIYFVQNVGKEGDRYDRHVVVIDSLSKAILFEQIFRGSEGGSPAPLNFVDEENGDYLNQFTGQLFKNQPPVIFGFMHHSFGCPGIDFIQKNRETIYINCDNRH